MSYILNAGLQSSNVIFTNINNNNLSAINSGRTNEISLFSNNPLIKLQLEYSYSISEKDKIAFNLAYCNGLLNTSIENISGKTIPAYEFNPSAYCFGFKYIWVATKK